MSLLRVVPLKNFLDTALSTSANGTAYSTVAPIAGQKVYGLLHLTGVSTGRTFVGSIQAASSSGFGAVTTEFSFVTLSSAVGASLQEFTPSTDRMWRRATWTLSTAASTAGSWNGLFGVGIR
jgi:hypothetical protein